MGKIAFWWVCFVLWQEGQQPGEMAVVGTGAGGMGLDHWWQAVLWWMWTPLGLRPQQAELSVLSRLLRRKML